MILALMAATAALTSVRSTSSCSTHTILSINHVRHLSRQLRLVGMQKMCYWGVGNVLLTTLRGPLGFAVREMCRNIILAGCTPMKRRLIDAISKGCAPGAPEPACPAPKPAAKFAPGQRTGRSLTVMLQPLIKRGFAEVRDAPPT